MRGTLVALILIAGCNDAPPKVDPFKPVPECTGVEVTPFMGSRTMVVSSLALADFNEGFDLNLDGKKDNKLAPLGSVANPTITDSFTKKHDIILPIEMYGYTGQPSTACVKFAFYIGRFNQDRDMDGKDTTWDTNDDGTSKGDCMDTDNTIGPSVAEVPGDRVDNDCDGFADNTSRGHAGTDTMDKDGDGFSPAQGDCDDRDDVDHIALAKTRHPGATEVCDNGIDEDCDGFPDKSDACDPFKQSNSTFFVQQQSLDANMDPLIQFKDGSVKSNVLSAGPDVFSLAIPFRNDSNINLELRGARVQMTLMDDGTGTTATQGMLGGVLEAASLAQITMIDAGGVIKPDQSLLDAVFVGAAAPILGLDSDKDGHNLPDIDVDGDGLETFWQENPDPTMSARVNVCKDGDGTIVKGLDCPLAKDKNGKPRFVDGLSVAIKFTAVPGKLGMVVPK
jgi:Putative metal-binding motif